MDNQFLKKLKSKQEINEPLYKTDEIYLEMIKEVRSNNYRYIIETIDMIYKDHKEWFPGDFISQINFYEEFIDEQEQKNPADRVYTKEFTAFAERLVEKFWSIICPPSGRRVEIYWSGGDLPGTTGNEWKIKDTDD